MLRHSIPPSKFLAEVSVAAKHGYAPVAFYHSRSRFHEHLTYSKQGSAHPRKNIVDVSLLKVGEPVTPSLMLGDMVKAREFQFNVESLNARGFLRFQKAYTPPADAAEKVMQICRSCMKIRGDDHTLIETKLEDSKLKYELLTKLFEQFQHGVPNSMLHMMCTPGNLVEFYCTKVVTNTPYEELIRTPDLPPNLHIQKNPIRFHPDNFPLAGGMSAYPKSSTVVTGLRAKKKYRGYEAKMTWP